LIAKRARPVTLVVRTYLHLLASPEFDQGSSTGFAYVRGPRVQHVHERCASLDRDGEPLGEAGLPGRVSAVWTASHLTRGPRPGRRRPGEQAPTVDHMSFTMEKLRSTADNDLFRLHDRAAENTVVGVSYYLDELRRREQAAAIKACHRLAFASFVLTAVNAVLAVAAVVIALAAG